MSIPARMGTPPNKPRMTARTPRAEISVVELCSMAHVPVWDVRPREERCSLPGYIPGSRSVPLSLADAMALPWGAIAQTSPYVVLVCLSGRRSGEICRELRATGQHCALQLGGGVLEWQASGLALCVPNVVEPEEWATVTSLGELRRAVSAWFLAEAVLLHEANNEGFVSPHLLVEHVLAAPEALSSFERAMTTLDLLAENARRLAHPTDRLAANLSACRSTLERLEQTGAFGCGEPPRFSSQRP